jgi:hypothetical protein
MSAIKDDLLILPIRDIASRQVYDQASVSLARQD